MADAKGDEKNKNFYEKERTLITTALLSALDKIDSDTINEVLQEISVSRGDKKYTIETVIGDGREVARGISQTGVGVIPEGSFLYLLDSLNLKGVLELADGTTEQVAEFGIGGATILIPNVEEDTFTIPLNMPEDAYPEGKTPESITVSGKSIAKYLTFHPATPFFKAKPARR